MAALRREESQRSLLHYGIPLDNQKYLGLPDGQLEGLLPQFQRSLGLLIVKHAISRLVTLGEDGYDGHRDHIASHIAAMGAAQNAMAAGHEVEVWALNSGHKGETAVSGDCSRKLGAMSLHISQR
ncbi:MAG: PIG-L family deacetylase, partial [Patescibacteria group bacterium]